jgi:V8-like Glu-specific endopeptidase
MMHALLILSTSLLLQQDDQTQSGTATPREAFAESAPQREAAMPEAVYNARQQRLREHHLPTPLGELPEARRGEAEPLPPPPTHVQPADAEAFGLSILQNRALTDLETNDATSTVGEPSVAMRGNEILVTGNWYASFSKNGGSTFSYRNPYNMFPAIPGRQFCCDQVAIYVPSHDLMVWFLQHGRNNTGNTIRLAVAKGNDITNERWRVYDFTPQSVGDWQGEWFDYADLAYSNQHLFLTTNSFDFSDRFKRSVAIRIPLAQLASYASINYRHLSRTDVGSLRPTQLSGDAMYIGTHANAGAIRVIRWRDAETTTQTKNFNVQTWSRGCSAPGPDGRDWLGAVDGRITGAWAAGGRQGFAWTSAPSNAMPKPHVRVAVIDWNAGTVVRQPHIWSNNVAYAYVGASSNPAGHVGVSIGFGGTSTLHPSHCVGIYNPTGAWSLTATANGTHGPESNRWGDYLTVRPHQDQFVATGYCMVGGSGRSQVVPRLIRFRPTLTSPGDDPQQQPMAPVGNGIARGEPAERSAGGLQAIATTPAAVVETVEKETGIRFSKTLKPAARSVMSSARDIVAFDGGVAAAIAPTVKKAVVAVGSDERTREWFAERSRLPPISRFFYDPPQTVCEPDGRQQHQSTGETPWSANCQLVITLNDGTRAVGSGWLMGPRLVVTAGHCVHEGEGGEFFKSVEVIPGMNGATQPFGTQVSTRFRAAESWKTQGLQARDYGAILLDQEFRDASGRSPATLTAANDGDAALTSAMIRISGYPADKPFGTQWFDAGAVSTVQPERLRYLVDTMGGHSGSAVVRADNPFAAVGIHNYGGCPNKCTRIVATVKADLDAWLAESNQQAGGGSPPEQRPPNTKSSP